MSDLDVSSDAHGTIEEHTFPTGIETSAPKIIAEPKLESTTNSRGGSMSTTAEILQPDLQDLPTVHVSEPESPPPLSQIQEAAVPTHSLPPPPPSPARSTGTDSGRSTRQQNRTIAETRATTNRLSGFFTNLIHRRDPTLPTSASRTAPVDEERPHRSTGALDSASASRAPSPTPVTRPVTPPPQLPAPTLRELGLSLSVLTSDLSPSHFSTPPTSGAFLGPHYLLLCHAQGLDVLPLISPPAPQPYALVRRVSFKSVVVMEQRGVLVAIAGRRDGVRVYALEEIKKAVAWRIDVEIRRERERSRRETSKKITLSSVIDFTVGDTRDSTDTARKASLSTPPPGNLSQTRSKLNRKISDGITPTPAPGPLIPRTPTIKRHRPPTPSIQIPSGLPEPLGRPPPYTSDISPRIPSVSQSSRSRRSSVSNVLGAATSSRRNTETNGPLDRDSKADWQESDDEAINVVAAGSSGSQALDERTSAAGNTSPAPAVPPMVRSVTASIAGQSTTRRNRPANLDLALTRTNSASHIPPEPSPTPTLLTLRQALTHSPADSAGPEEYFGNREGEDDDDDEFGPGITLAEALFESRIPELPPVGTRRTQQPILINRTADDEPASPRTSEGHSVTSRTDIPETTRRRRRWSVLDGMFTNGSSSNLPASAPGVDGSGNFISTSPSPGRMARTPSFRSNTSLPRANSPGLNASSSVNSNQVPPVPDTSSVISASRSRFIPRLINAFNGRRSEDSAQAPTPKVPESNPTTTTRRHGQATTSSHAPPPKLDYVKLPGTKGAIIVKAVETAKKSFLAILCGENGEKVELFAGTYRTALGLSRTFILPDSPRSLELQLQGDDLVEVFLVFSQNVFGLEPATVRVREVRIGRAERRAARRRAREIRTGDAGGADGEQAEEDTNVNVSIGVSVAVEPGTTAPSNEAESSLTPAQHPGDDTVTPNEPPTNASATALAQAEEVVALATAQMGPYTTFQQLSFAPQFPLASIADEYIIPPTYPDFLEYRTQHEPDTNGNHSVDLTQIQFSPPGLPVPAPSPPSKWFYRDPKDVIHGPWKTSLMHAWYKDGLLPPNLPVRREEDADFILLRDLRLQSLDPTHPFRSLPPPCASSDPIPSAETAKPLLAPISLLAQPRRFGPPALFFSSRGGHSTAIVDARGRSVLKGRLVWSASDEDDSKLALPGRMGDVKRLEAFDVKDRAVLVAMRQGGFEAVDLGDALLRPGDESRTILPQFSSPPSNTNRREPFVWRMGTPVFTSATSATVLTSVKHKTSYMPIKKQITGVAKSPAGRTEFANGDAEADVQDEVLFLGRKDDEIYICERNSASFRILRLCPHST